jgi:polyphosphate kinase 2 (PPK2 family)
VAKQKKNAVSLKPKLKRKAYEKELERLQAELCHLQEWVKDTGSALSSSSRDATVPEKEAPSRPSQSA